MILRTVLRVALAIAVTLPLPSNTAEYVNKSPHQEGKALKSHKVLSHETETRVLDILFPRDETAKNYLFVLRFRPSFHPESQIVVKGDGDKIEVLEYTLLSGNIYDKLDDVLAHGGSEDAVEMARLIKVRRRSIEVPYSKVKQWRAGFLGSFCELSKSFRDQTEKLDKKGTITLVLDGTYYDLWDNQGMNKMSFSFYDEEVSEQQPNGALKMVQWMNAVRHDVERLR